MLSARNLEAQLVVREKLEQGRRPVKEPAHGTPHQADKFGKIMMYNRIF